MKLKTKDMIYVGAFAALLMAVLFACIATGFDPIAFSVCIVSALIAEICMALGKYKSKKYNYFFQQKPGFSKLSFCICCPFHRQPGRKGIYSEMRCIRTRRCFSRFINKASSTASNNAERRARFIYES